LPELQNVSSLPSLQRDAGWPLHVDDNDNVSVVELSFTLSLYSTTSARLMKRLESTTASIRSWNRGNDGRAEGETLLGLPEGTMDGAFEGAGDGNVVGDGEGARYCRLSATSPNE
jgi:hypothetical protein